MFDKNKFENTGKENGILSFKYEDRDAFEKGAPVPVKTLKEVHKYSKAYVEEATNVATELAKENFKKDKSLNKVIVNVPYSTSAHGHANITVTREKEYVNRLNGNNEVIRKSAIQVVVKDPAAEVPKSKIHELVDDLTATFCK